MFHEKKLKPRITHTHTSLAHFFTMQARIDQMFCTRSIEALSVPREAELRQMGEILHMPRFERGCAEPDILRLQRACPL